MKLFARLSPRSNNTGSVSELEKYEWEFAGKTFVFSTKRGCSGRNVTPEQLSDLLVGLIEN